MICVAFSNPKSIQCTTVQRLMFKRAAACSTVWMCSSWRFAPLYHVAAHGNKQDDIFLGGGDDDRVAFLDTLDRICDRFNWTCHAYCLMSNHLLIETPDANLSKGMQQLNGIYTQHVNRCHGRVGHLFQGRFKSILVEKDRLK